MARSAHVISFVVLAVVAGIGGLSAAGADPRPQEKATGDIETVRVLPDAAPVTTKTTFQPGRSYLVQISGTITRTSTGGGDTTYVQSAFDCLQGPGCPDDANDDYTTQYFVLTDEQRSGTPFTGYAKSASEPPFDAQGNYRYRLDGFEVPTTLTFSIPADSATVNHSGNGFTFDFVEEEVVQAAKFQAKIEGQPQGAPKDMISGIVQTRGKVIIDVSAKRVDANGATSGKVAFVSINEGKDELVVLKLGPEGAYRENDGSRGAVSTGKVSKSTMKRCEEGDKGSLSLIDHSDTSKDALALVSAKCKIKLNWKRAPDTDEFALEVKAPE